MSKKILFRVHKSDPKGISNIALWKLVNFMEIGEVSYLNKSGQHHLSIVYQNQLIFYYSWVESEGHITECNENMLYTEESLKAFDFYILNENQYNVLKPDGEHDVSYPLFLDHLLGVKLEAYESLSFDFEKDFDEAAELINTCYSGYQYNSGRIKEMMTSIAFSPNLWVWILDKNSGEKVALGIGDYYDDLKEASFDWVQVNPTHHGKKVGQYLISEMIKRLSNDCETCRVTGMNDKFYEKCGFIKFKPWYLFTKKRG